MLSKLKDLISKEPPVWPIVVMLVIKCIVEVAHAGDKHFKYIQPVDNFISKHLVWDRKDVAGNISDYTIMAVGIMPYVYGALKSEHRAKRLTTAAGVHLLNATLTDWVKMKTQRTRPNNEDKMSFFSGHTSSAFASAGLICLQERDKDWCYPALALAAATGYFRIAAKKHFFSDVVVGAGIGYANGRFYPKLIMSF